MVAANAVQMSVPDAHPVLDFPMLTIFLITVPLWCAAAWLGISGVVPAPIAIAAMAVAAYVGFTVMHECVHGNMSRYPIVNALFGNLASFLLGPTSCFRAYCYLHLEHHRHTNDQKNDPDFWSGGGAKWLLPIRWLTTDLRNLGSKQFLSQYLRYWQGHRCCHDDIPLEREAAALLTRALTQPDRPFLVEPALASSDIYFPWRLKDEYRP